MNKPASPNVEVLDQADKLFAIANKSDEPTNVLIVGVGGQGVIMVSKVLALLCQNHGYQVKQSEVHGMAKRGGCVFSHVRFGKQVWSPTIPSGQADILLALEWAEGLRWLNSLKPGKGVFICDTQQIVPPFACLNRKRGESKHYSEETPEEIAEHVALSYAMEASAMADKLGNERAANTVLLGALSRVLAFPVEDWEKIIKEFVPPRTIDINIEAFRLGREWIENIRSETSLRSTPPREIKKEKAVSDNNIQSTLEITEEWCKSCDICVKMCPERCLRLNSNQIVELSDPDACTGCRICEWLCPDYAITVHNDPVEVA